MTLKLNLGSTVDEGNDKFSNTSSNLHTENWQESLSDLITNPHELLAIAKLDPESSRFSELATQDFPLKVPRQFAALIRPGDWNDPILAQIWPTVDETSNSSSHSYDPLKETTFTPETGLLHKYKNRVLLITAPHCAINCRYCFRRPLRLPNQFSARKLNGNGPLSIFIAIRTWKRLFSVAGTHWHCQTDASVGLLSQVEEMPHHVTTLRVHTRLPIVIPQRVTSKILEKFKSTRLKIVLVTHCNHANELTQKTQNAFTRLREVGVLLLNQSVLLAGINDDALILAALSKKLFSQNILPYYLHMPDAVQGTQHFAVKERAALKVMDDLRSLLSGYLVPTLVREDPGAPSKTRI